MNILEITGEPILHGGQENFIYNILENINNTSFNIDVLTPYYCDNNRFKALISEKKGKVYELNLDFRPWKSRKLICKPVLEFLKKKNYDLIHIHSGSISVLAYEAQAAQKAGIKKIIVHSHSTGEKGLKHTMIQTAFSPLLKKYPTHYLACNKEAGEMKFPKSVQPKVQIIKNGINLNRFTRNQDIGNELRAKYGIPKDAFVVGHIGRFTIEKNHSFLIDCFESINRKIYDSYLVLVGEGELQAEMKAKAKKLGLNDKVIFTGVVDNPYDYYNVFNYFVLPSIYEGFPFVTLEAQANGLPCLISTGVPETVMLTKYVKRLDLNTEKWAEFLVNNSSSGIQDNMDCLKEQGFDIAESAKIIERIYTQ